MVADARRRAEQQAEEQLASARALARTVTERATELVRRLAQGEEVRRNLEALIREVESLDARLQVRGRGSSDLRPTVNGDGARAQTGAPPRPEPTDEARLMALQMAMAGRTRAEVESDLRHGLRVEGAQSIVDEVFGKGTPGSQRIPWSGVS